MQAAQLPRRLFYFLLDQKVTKNQVNRHLLLRCTRLLPCNQPKPRAAILCPTSVRAVPLLQQSLLMPFPALKAVIVLSDFARSWSVDRVHLVLLTLLNESKIKEREADRKAGRVYGVNDGLAFAMCAARKRRKEPAERAEAFFCLDFLVTFGSSQK